MGFSGGGLWVMGYGRPMGYGMHFPAHQLGGLILLWDITGYGFSRVWVITGSTVLTLVLTARKERARRARNGPSHLQSTSTAFHRVFGRQVSGLLDDYAWLPRPRGLKSMIHFRPLGY